MLIGFIYVCMHVCMYVCGAYKYSLISFKSEETR